MRRISIVVRFLVLVTAAWLGLLPAAAAAAPPLDLSRAWKVEPAPGLSAGAAILMDWRTGAILYQKDAFRRRDPASTTKVLTAIIALEEGRLTDKVTISRRAASTIGSAMHIGAGEVYSLHDLIHGLMLRSGNDAAVAIAEHLSGSVEAFASRMTAKAKAIGAQNSHFANPHGLTTPDHYSTAYDLAVITRYALQNPTFRQIVSLQAAPLTFEHLNRDVVLHNTNRLLSMMPEADGVKTGTTAAAGRCLIASATRDEQKLIAVVLNAGNRWNDSARLLTWGFDTFRLTLLGQAGEVLRSQPVRGGKPDRVPLTFAGDLAMVLPRKGAALPEVRVEVQERINAPISQGQVLGKVTVLEGGVAKAATELLAGQAVAKRNLIDNLIRGLTPLIRWMKANEM